MKRSPMIALSAAMLALAAACGSSTPVDATGMERAFINAAGGPVKSMCDPAFTHWSCFYDGVEAGSGYLVVKLTTDGGTDTSGMAGAAGAHWFNFIHCDFPDLDTIVVRVNGVDHNVNRSDTNADLLRC